MLGCECKVCTSTEPRNQRTRASVVLKLPREKIRLVHAVVYTHYHVDHVFGLDDLRIFPRYLGGALPIYCTDDVEEVIRQAFSYAFHPGNEELPAGLLPKLVFQRITHEPFTLLGEHVVPIPLIHGRFNVLGFRVGNLAYCTDVSSVPESSVPLLADLDTLILDTLTPGPPHPSHFNLEQALTMIERVRPKQTYLTHMSHGMDYCNPPPMPSNVAMAYDGLMIPF
jgi:phosphoribosyl 1,2-cyclic phosphate phosphodiesterase